MAKVKDLYDFLVEAELSQYYGHLTATLKVNTVGQLKDVLEEDLAAIGMTKPEQRRLHRFYKKEYPRGTMKKMRKMFSKDKSSSRPKIPYPAAMSGYEPVRSSRHIIPAEAISINKEIGKGEFGLVQQGVWTNGDGERIQVAIKCLTREKVRAGQADFLKEATIMHSLDHPSLVRLFGVVLDFENSLMLVTELAPLRSLSECLKEPAQRSSFPVTQLCHFALQISQGMKYLHSKNVIHRDLAIRNILVFSKSLVKISDFGLSRTLGVDKDFYQTAFNVDLRLPLAWCAPECINYLTFTTASDIWSFGVTCWEMFTYGWQPWAALSGPQILEAIDKPHYKRLEIPDACPVQYYDLMLKCWSHDSSKRPSFEELCDILPEIMPVEMRALSECTETGSDYLSYKANEIITVLDKRNANNGWWKGALENGQVGLFNSANTATRDSTDYLTVPVLAATAVSLSPGKAKGSSSYKKPGKPKDHSKPKDIPSPKDKRKSSTHITSDMISLPKSDFKHTTHIGVASIFGDVTFLQEQYHLLPGKVSEPLQKKLEEMAKSPQGELEPHPVWSASPRASGEQKHISVPLGSPSLGAPSPSSLASVGSVSPAQDDSTHSSPATLRRPDHLSIPVSNNGVIGGLLRHQDVSEASSAPNTSETANRESLGPLDSPSDFKLNLDIGSSSLLDEVLLTVERQFSGEDKKEPPLAKSPRNSAEIQTMSSNLFSSESTVGDTTLLSPTMPSPTTPSPTGSNQSDAVVTQKQRQLTSFKRSQTTGSLAVTRSSQKSTSSSSKRSPKTPPSRSKSSASSLTSEEARALRLSSGTAHSPGPGGPSYGDHLFEIDQLKLLNKERELRRPEIGADSRGLRARLRSVKRDAITDKGREAYQLLVCGGGGKDRAPRAPPAPRARPSLSVAAAADDSDDVDAVQYVDDEILVTSPHRKVSCKSPGSSTSSEASSGGAAPLGGVSLPLDENGYLELDEDPPRDPPPVDSSPRASAKVMVAQFEKKASRRDQSSAQSPSPSRKKVSDLRQIFAAQQAAPATSPGLERATQRAEGALPEVLPKHGLSKSAEHTPRQSPRLSPKRQPPKLSTVVPPPPPPPPGERDDQLDQETPPERPPRRPHSHHPKNLLSPKPDFQRSNTMPSFSPRHPPPGSHYQHPTSNPVSVAIPDDSLVYESHYQSPKSHYQSPKGPVAAAAAWDVQLSQEALSKVPQRRNRKSVGETRIKRRSVGEVEAAAEDLSDHGQPQTDGVPGGSGAEQQPPPQREESAKLKSAEEKMRHRPLPELPEGSEKSQEPFAAPAVRHNYEPVNPLPVPPRVPLRKPLPTNRSKRSKARKQATVDSHGLSQSEPTAAVANPATQPFMDRNNPLIMSMPRERIKANMQLAPAPAHRTSASMDDTDSVFLKTSPEHVRRALEAKGQRAREKGRLVRQSSADAVVNPGGGGGAAGEMLDVSLYYHQQARGRDDYIPKSPGLPPGAVAGGAAAASSESLDPDYERMPVGRDPGRTGFREGHLDEILAHPLPKAESLEDLLKRRYKTPDNSPELSKRSLNLSQEKLDNSSSDEGYVDMSGRKKQQQPQWMENCLEVQEMKKALPKEVSAAVCVAALKEHRWDVSQALKEVKVQYLSGMKLADRHQCRAVLEGVEWDLEEAAQQLVKSAERQGDVVQL